MKIKSLLAAVSMVAIAAGSANALSITNTTPAGALTPALELQLPGTPALNGLFTFTVDTTLPATYPGGNNLLVRINTPGGTTLNTAFNPALTIGANASTPNVQAGGAPGDNFVELLVAIQQPNTDNTLGFTLDLELNACPTSALNVTVETENNTPIEQGAAAADTANRLIGNCASAIDGVVTSDESASDTTITLASGYTQLAEFVGGVVSATPIVLGDINYSIDPTVTTTIPTLTPLASTDVAALRFAVMFEDATGIQICSIKPDGVAANPSIIGTIVGNMCNFDITAAADLALMTNGVADEIRVSTTGNTVAIPTQTVSVGNSAVIFRTTGAPDLIVNEPGATGGLDTLQREGREFGYFDWNAGPAIAEPTSSVYRITGLTPGAAVDYSLTLENSNNNGSYAGTITADATGEAVLVSTTMPVPADTGRFDVLINLETPNTDVDVDRLMLRGGIVTAFNDGGNNDQEDSKEPNLNDTDN